jgi:hypothetical protein
MQLKCGFYLLLELKVFGTCYIGIRIRRFKIADPQPWLFSHQRKHRPIRNVTKNKVSAMGLSRSVT